MFLKAFEMSLPCCMSGVSVLVQYFIKSPGLYCQSEKKKIWFQFFSLSFMPMVIIPFLWCFCSRGIRNTTRVDPFVEMFKGYMEN